MNIDIKAIREAHTGDACPANIHPATVLALCDEVERLRGALTPLEASEITDHIRGMDVDTREDLCSFSFKSGVRWAEKQHGITGESR